MSLKEGKNDELKGKEGREGEGEGEAEGKRGGVWEHRGISTQRSRAGKVF